MMGHGVMRSRWSARNAGRRMSSESACSENVLPPQTKNPGYVAVLYTSKIQK